MVRDLPKQQRDLLHLVYVSGMTVDIAGIRLGLTPQQAHTLHTKSLVMIHRSLL